MQESWFMMTQLRDPLLPSEGKCSSMWGQKNVFKEILEKAVYESGHSLKTIKTICFAFSSA